MGQEIVYCSACQNRLLGSDFEKGRAFRVAHTIFCKTCLPPGQDVERPSPRKGSSTRIAPVRRLSPVPADRKPLLIPLVAGAILVIMLLAIVAGTGGAAPRSQPLPAVVKVEPEPPAQRPEPAPEPVREPRRRPDPPPAPRRVPDAVPLREARMETPPPPPVAPPPEPARVNPEVQAYRATWESAVRLAAGRDYAAAIGELERAAAPSLRTEIDDDLALFRLARTAYAEAVKLATQGQRIALEVFDEHGQKRRVEGTIARVDLMRIVIRKDRDGVAVEWGEVTASSLALRIADRKAAALLCLLEGEPPGSEIPPEIPAKYRSLPMASPEALAREAAARSLFFEAEGDHRSAARRVDSLEKYKALLSTHADTVFVRRNRASIAQRPEAAMEYVFFAGNVRAGGTFKPVEHPKAGPAWISAADGDPARMKENFVQIEFSTLPEAVYRCWVYMGGCCGETLSFAVQGTEMTAPLDADRGVAVKPGFTVPSRTHASHSGPKQPSRWGWTPIPLPKYASPGAKTLRVITSQAGFGLGCVVVSASRKGPPTEGELKEMERPAPEEVPVPGLEGHWKLEGDARDSSGHGRHGAFVRSPRPATGKLGGALEFDQESHVSVPSAPALSFASSDSFTVCAWVLVPSVTPGYSGLVTKSREAKPHYGLWIGNGKWVFGGGTGNIEDGTVTVGWHHVAGVQDGTSRRRTLYVDGVPIGSGGAQDGNGPGEIQFGAAKGVKESFTGALDDVRIYSRALGSADIAGLAQAR